MNAFWKKYGVWIVAVVIVIIILVIVYYVGKGKGTTKLTIKDDTNLNAPPTDEEKQKAKQLAASIKDDIYGINIWGHDEAIYMDLIQQSNVVFGLTWAEYKNLTGNTITKDLNGEYQGLFGEWDILKAIKQRAADLKLS